MSKHRIEAVIISKSERERQREAEARVWGRIALIVLVIGLLYVTGLIGPYR